MQLTEYNTTGYCTDYCRQKHTGVTPAPPQRPVHAKQPKQGGIIVSKRIDEIVKKEQEKYGNLSQETFYHTGTAKAYAGKTLLHQKSFKSQQQLKSYIDEFLKSLPGCEISVIFDEIEDN